MGDTLTVLVAVNAVPTAGTTLDQSVIRVLVGIDGVPTGTPVDPGDPSDPLTVNLPAFGATVGMYPGLDTSYITFAVSAPADGDRIYIAKPDFTVGVQAADAEQRFTVEVQYDEHADFSSPTTLSTQVQSVDGGALLSATQSLSGDYYWRARLLDSDGVFLVGWRSGGKFSVNTSVNASTVPVSWTVSTSAERPVHLWHLDPDGPEIGQAVTAYGQGFPASGHLLFGENILTADSWNLIAATSANASVDRLIDADTVTCEHYEVVFTAPEVDTPGEVLSVEA
jgi:hypothetical protein